ncbi:MAG TPA: hypothetical protein VFC46_04730 [Humisphaera sp.]|nr:hypothetical protein [Humisphaera sp.]
MLEPTRREFLRTTGAVVAAGMGMAHLGDHARAFVPSTPEIPAGDRPPQDKSVTMLHPRGRVPVSFIIDDSTCLVNMGAFCMPQFRAAWPQNPIYWKPWKNWPREIPNDFVREFGQFAAEQGVRGKYSLIPYPACVGWLDREMPGWSKKDLAESLQVMRELISPRFDITPEMVTHTRVIDIRTGRPMSPVSPGTMENSFPQQKKSAAEFAEYIAYALGILKNCEIDCTGVTTPGGFGNAYRSDLSLGMRQAVTDVYKAEIPFYFKYVADDKDGTQPRLEHVEGIIGADGTTTPKLVVNVPASIGDNFGGWDGDRVPEGEKYISHDGTTGRMAELIQRGEPAVMFGHWAGLYSNGSKHGLTACKKVITTINATYADRITWMKSSEMARYWAARELTRIDRTGNKVSLAAPFACPAYTVRITSATAAEPNLKHDGQPIPLTRVDAMSKLTAGTWLADKEGVVACFDLPKGQVAIAV